MIFRIVGVLGLLSVLAMAGVELFVRGLFTAISIAIGWGPYGGWLLLVSMGIIYASMIFHPRRRARGRNNFNARV